MMKTNTFPSTLGVKGQPEAVPVQIRVVLPWSSQLSEAALAGDKVLVPDQLPLVPTRRLVVLLPGGEIDELALARRVFQLADPSGLKVLYLSLSPDPALVASQRRRLAVLAAQSTSPLVRTDISVFAEGNWPEVLKQTLQPGDLLVCLAEDYLPGLFRHEAVGEHLANHLGTPVYMLGDPRVKSSVTVPNWIKNVFAWFLSFLVIAAFFWMQLGIDRASGKPQSALLLCLSVVVELYIILKINDWVV